MAYRIFVSYSTKDLELAAHIKFLLESPEIKVYVAAYSLGAGSELTPEILKAIKGCDLFLLLWSPNAKQSEWVPQEIGVAKAFERPVIPILLKKGGEAPGFLRGLKYLPLYSDPTKALAWLQQHVAHKAKSKSKSEGVALLTLFGGVLWALSQSER